MSGVHGEVRSHSEYVQTVYGDVCGGMSGLTSRGEGYVENDKSGMHDMQQSSAGMQPWSVSCRGKSGLLGSAGSVVDSDSQFLENASNRNFL